MPILIWISNALASPLIAPHIPALIKWIGEYFAKRAERSLSKAAVIQAKAARSIEDNAKRAEVLREASAKLSSIIRSD